MIAARFIENATQEPVTVDCVETWGSEERTCIVTYVSGRKYALRASELGQLFSIVSPQEVFVTAFGGFHDRPLPSQRGA